MPTQKLPQTDDYDREALRTKQYGDMESLVAASKIESPRAGRFVDWWVNAELEIREHAS